jgi:hypothetical protein
MRKNVLPAGASKVMFFYLTHGRVHEFETAAMGGVE